MRPHGLAEVQLGDVYSAAKETLQHIDMLFTSGFDAVRRPRKIGDPVQQEKQSKYASLVANKIMLSKVARLEPGVFPTPSAQE